jgi:hypothetical protein
VERHQLDKTLKDRTDAFAALVGKRHQHRP